MFALGVLSRVLSPADMELMQTNMVVLGMSIILKI